MRRVHFRAGRLDGLAAICFLTLSSAWLAAGAPLGTDYANPICAATRGVYPCDDPAPSILALIHGDLRGVFAHQPPMGPFSLILRAPFAALGGASQTTMYRLGAWPCLLALGLAGLLVAAAMARAGRPRWLQALVLAGFLFNPLTSRALYFGHPEELLAAALVIGALLVAAGGRSVLAGVLFGAAVATKEWALLAAMPVVIAAPAGARVRLLGAAGAAALGLAAPMIVGNPHVFLMAMRSIGAIATRPGTVTPANVWWPFAHFGVTHWLVTVGGRQSPITETGYALPATLGQLTHPLIIALAGALSLLYVRRGAGREPAELLTLIALILLVRCVLDPFTFSYHHAPFLLSLLAGEGLRRRGIPVLAVISAGALFLLSHQTLSPQTMNASYLAWALAMGGLLSVTLFAPHRLVWLRRAELAAG